MGRASKPAPEQNAVYGVQRTYVIVPSSEVNRPMIKPLLIEAVCLVAMAVLAVGATVMLLGGIGL